MQLTTLHHHTMEAKIRYDDKVIVLYRQNNLTKISLKVHESPPPYSDTGHDILTDVIMVNRSTPIGGASHSNDTSSISIISNACPDGNVITANSSISEDKEERTIHI